MNKIYDAEGKLQFVTSEGRFSKEEISEICSSMNKNLARQGARIDLGYRTVDVDGVTYRIKPAQICPIYSGIGAARRCMDLKEYAAADGILDSVQELLEKQNEL